MNFETIWTMLQPILVVVIGLVGTVLARKFVKTREDSYRMELFDKVADNTLALIRLNNPGLKLLDSVQVFEDKLFEALMAEPRVTNAPDVIKRVAAATVANAAIAESGAFPVRQ